MLNNMSDIFLGLAKRMNCSAVNEIQAVYSRYVINSFVIKFTNYITSIGILLTL